MSNISTRAPDDITNFSARRHSVNELAARVTTLSLTDTPHLLKLPAELRNYIYGFVLVSDKHINVGAHYRTPALLTVSRQIRSESAPIYYEQNNFNFAMPNYDPRYVLRFSAQFKLHADWERSWKKGKLFLHVRNEPFVWDNLLQWLERWFESGGPSYTTTKGTLQQMAVSGAFGVLRPIRGKVAWEDAKVVVEVYRKAAEVQAAGAWKWL